MKTKILTHKRIESYLPIFPGFYGTIFEADEDYIIEDGPYTFDDYNFEYEEYSEAMTRACVDAIERQLPEIGINGISITWQSVSSPREYNFTNDSVNVLYKLTDESLKGINEYIAKHSEAFQKYLTEHFTSYDGFISFYSPSLEVWVNDYLNNKDKLRTLFGSLLDFIFENEQYTWEDLYDDCDSVYLDGSLKDYVGEINAKIKAYTQDEYCKKDISLITAELATYFDVSLIVHDWLTSDYIERMVTTIFKNVAKITNEIEF